jgi:hypothetical protein
MSEASAQAGREKKVEAGKGFHCGAGKVLSINDKSLPSATHKEIASSLG